MPSSNGAAPSFRWNSGRRCARAASWPTMCPLPTEEYFAMRLTGKTALITAAAAGIGRATALAFAREGAQVIAADVNGRELAALGALQTSIRPEVLDVT